MVSTSALCDLPRFLTYSSPVRSRAWVSQVVPWNSKEPNVIECLFYWFVSALGQRDFYEDVFTKLGVSHFVVRRT